VLKDATLTMLLVPVVPYGMVWYVVFHIIKMTCNRTIFSRVLDSFCQSEKIREHIIAGRDTLVIRGSHISVR